MKGISDLLCGATIHDIKYSEYEEANQLSTHVLIFQSKGYMS